MQIEKIPLALRELPQWVLWQSVERDGKATKLPFQVCGQMAKSNDPATWATFADAAERHGEGGFAGLGFMFSADDPFCGIDLDGCRNAETGKVEDWAREIVQRFASYAEVSPSGAGVKIFCRGTWGLGKKVPVKDAAKVSEKEPGVEVYDRLRYFAVTGERLKTGQDEPQDRQEAIDWLRATFFPDLPAEQKHFDFRSDDAVVERARKYIAKLPPAVSGQGGHNAAFHAACVLVLGFQLAEAEALGLMHEYNRTCDPPWSEKELLHKVRQAAKQPGERGYLRNAAPSRWASLPVPTYQEQPAKAEPRETTLVDATLAYVERLKTGDAKLIELGIPDLDYAIGGGVEPGELIIFAARPSHGKSAVALQCVHHWTANAMPCAMVSEEMSALALGKRTLQYLSPLPQEHWRDQAAALKGEVIGYAGGRQKCFILEGCRTAQAAAEGVERLVKANGVQCVVVDYAQLLQAPGKGRYEQVTNTSITLRQLASSLKIVVLALVQASRDLDSRAKFEPTLSDLKDTGQFEQDADVVIFLCWPHRIDETVPPGKYQFFVEKVRNRQRNQRAVVCHFNPARQTVRDDIPETRYAQSRIPD